MVSIPYSKPANIYKEIPTLKVLAQEYMKSSWYKGLTKRVKDDYRKYIEILVSSPNANTDIDKISRRLARTFYEAVLEQSNTHDAAKFVGVWRRLYNFAIDQEYVSENPWNRMGIKKPGPRSVVWTSEQVKNVIDKALEMGYSDLARLVCLCYDSAQRPGDVYKLTRNNVKKDSSGYYLDFKQSKTGKHVQPTISPFTVQLLGINEEWFTWDLYLVSSNNLEPCERTISEKFRNVKKVLGYGDIHIRDLRRTAINEMSDASDDAIMSASGHVNRNQLNTYSLRSRDKARTAQNARKTTWLGGTNE